MNRPLSGEIRDAAVAVVSAAAEAAEFVRNDSSDSCGIEDDKKLLLSKGLLIKVLHRTILEKEII